MMRIPIATYRVQLNAEFGFEATRAIAHYLSELGISDLYASPIFKARVGSSHGYDVVDPNQFNPELGSEESFQHLVAELQKYQMGWLQDIVPNHMAYDSQNRYLMDVLEQGSASTYRDYFDILWNAPLSDSQDSILAPLLGDFYGTCLENGEIQLCYEPEGLSAQYYALKLPLRLESYVTLLSYDLGRLVKVLGRQHPDFIKLLGILYLLKNIPAETTGKQRQDQSSFSKTLLWELYTSNPEVKNFIDENICIFNGEKGKSESFNRLDQLLTEQFFRLAYWKVGTDEMNYRRFFTVNELISIRVEDPKVFHGTHQWIIQQVKAGTFTGLRIDHIDGLYNPTEYLQRLQEKVGDLFITVEKILEPGEDLPEIWKIQGTSGYDFLNQVNGLFCQLDHEEKFDQIYARFTGNTARFEQVMTEKKHLILDKRLAGDLDNLTSLLKKIASRHRYGNDFTLHSLRQAIAAVLICFPIYRTYTTGDGVLEGDRIFIQRVIQTARETAPTLHHEFNFIERLLLLEYDPNLSSVEKEQWIYFVMRLQQYTGPLMAKGVEDTAFYVYHRLISLNEVGGDPGYFGTSVEDFHRFNQHRQARWSHTMNTTATHDTKRGEDVRARINVLSEIPEEWEAQVITWRELNQVYKTHNRRQIQPSPNDEYLFYQMLVGAFPFDAQERSGFCDRMNDYAIKAVREAKVFTTWLEPNPAYENACTQFIQAILQDSPENPFLQSFLPFQKRIADYGIFNSLSQTLLKVAAPGLPDFYQGTELWDLSLVDPDNRRPVDFTLRQSYLREIQQGIQAGLPTLLPRLLAERDNGKIKLFLVLQSLQVRAQWLEVFERGDYTPLTLSGRFQHHGVAFARSWAGKTLVAIAPRWLTRLVAPGQAPLGKEVWQDTVLHLPSADSIWTNLLTQESLRSNAEDAGAVLPLGQILNHFPVALLVNAG